jgi:hypothetical protein
MFPEYLKDFAWLLGNTELVDFQECSEGSIRSLMVFLSYSTDLPWSLGDAGFSRISPIRLHGVKDKAIPVTGHEGP